MLEEFYYVSTNRAEARAHFRHRRPQSIRVNSSSDHSDPKSEIQRALEVAHLVAPTPEAKGKIERCFGTFQRRLVTLMAHAKVQCWEHADQILQISLRFSRRVNHDHPIDFEECNYEIASTQRKTLTILAPSPNPL